MQDDDLNPDDMSELEGIFAQMIEDDQTGYIMEFVISKLAAKELVEAWTKACDGDTNSFYLSMHEYGKIMREMQDALAGDKY
jgi:hypothetical protein